MNPPRPQGSIRRRLILQLLTAAALLAALLYFSIRTVADAAVETTQDGILGAAATAVAEQVRGGDEGVEIDIPYSAFSMLGATGEDRVFYRILVGGETVTGYDDLPLPPERVRPLAPVFYTEPFRDTEVRIAALERTLLVAGRPVAVQVLVAQTRLGQAAIVATMANRAAALGFGFFGIAVLLSLVTARSVLSPIGRLAEAVARRGPRDLRPLAHPSPAELAPFVTALNAFIARLRGALARTETFIAEAAHHIRTPLATVRTQTEIALRQTEDEATRATLRAVIRAVEASARSATQLLDHATVVYRSDQRAEERLDLAQLARDVVRGLAPTAELKDLSLAVAAPEAPPDAPLEVIGDRLLIESALRNLIDNAIKYSPPDTAIEIDLARDGTEAAFGVADRGRGLSGAAARDLTRRFHRGTNVEDVVGSGLGLTIVEEVAAAHGGRFEIAPRDGGGTVARLTLPLA